MRRQCQKIHSIVLSNIPKCPKKRKECAIGILHYVPLCVFYAQSF